jgi:hypothetical protein
MRRIARHLSFANIIASLALFVALGGASYAAVKLPAKSVGTKQVKDRAITQRKISRAALKSLRGAKGPQGIQGLQGPQGIQGPKGDAGSTVIADGGITSSKLAASSVTQSKLGLTESFKQGPYSNIDPKAATAECLPGTSVIGGSTMVVDNNDNPLIGVAAVSYSGPAPIFNPHLWEGTAYRTAGSSSYGLDVIAYCSAS